MLVCVSSCSKKPQELSGGIEIEVDGVEYRVYRHAIVSGSGRLVYFSTLLVSLSSEPAPIAKRSGESSLSSTIVTAGHTDEERCFAMPDTLYFFQEGKIAFEKRYWDLGIDAQRLNADLEEVRDYLRPILEKLIRENVPPQEPETEEEP